jgi:DNA repair protein RAD50
MSYLNTLGIRGIRSFDPNREAVIKFFRPLTVIVGENGCGKTTIIECLKYATTSSTPEGRASGAMWVHDPQIAKEAEIKASVRLKFTVGDASRQYTSKQIMRVRRTKARAKKGEAAASAAAKTSFTTLDATLTLHMKDEKDKHLNQKCSDLSQAVPKLLGTSRALLENVIFCHQEDSNWPMGNAKDLQDKFNAIFMVMRYKKASCQPVGQRSS